MDLIKKNPYQALKDLCPQALSARGELQLPWIHLITGSTPPGQPMTFVSSGAC